MSNLKKLINEIEVDEKEKIYKEDALEQLDILTGKIKGATSYRVLNMQSGLSNRDKKLVEYILNYIQYNYPEDGLKCIDMILSAFNAENIQ